MKINRLKLLLLTGLMLGTTPLGWGYAYLNPISSWSGNTAPGYIAMTIKLDPATPTTFQDGATYNSSVAAAMNRWNTVLPANVIQFSHTTAPADGTASQNETNEIILSGTVEGDAFGTGVLAVTLSYSIPSVNEIVESDIIVNNAVPNGWNSYRGALQNPDDIRRVILHELGHVLGLDHPDQHGQTVTAIMNSTESNIDDLQPDDINGAQGLYGVPGQVFAPANDNFANAATITLTNNAATVTGSNNLATKEPGEPAIATYLNSSGVDDGTGKGGRSVWWKWTAPSTGSVTFLTQGSRFDTMLGVYTGSAVNSLTQIAVNDDALNLTVSYSAVTFTAIVGTTYYIAVDGWAAYSGFVTLGVTFTPPPPPAQTNGIAYNTTNFPAKVTPGASVSFTYNVTNSGTLPWGANHYLVLRDNSGTNIFFAPLNGVAPGGSTTATLTFTAPTTPGVYNYSVLAEQNGVAYFGPIKPLPLTVALSLGSDFNNDGRIDLLWSNAVTGERSIWLLNGLTISDGSSLGTVPPPWTVSGTSDFDGDGKADILWTNTATGDRAMWLMNGLSMSANLFVANVPIQWMVSAVGDFDGDGKADILWSNTVTGDRVLWFMNGNTRISAAYIGTVPVAWTVSGVGDFNGDGKADILWSNTATGERSIWLMNGSTISGGASLGIVSLEWSVSGTGDFDGDGKSDIVWTDTATGDRAMWLMNGTAISANLFLGNVSVAWIMSSTGDFDGDGKADIFWSNTITGDRSMWLMNGGTIASGSYITTIPVEWSVSK